MKNLGKFQTFYSEHCHDVKKFSAKFFFMVILFLSISSLASAQRNMKQIKLNFENAPIIKIINSIEKQSDFRFFYNNDVSTKQTSTINIATNNIDEIVSKVFKKLPIDYKISGNRIVLFIKQTNENKSKPHTIKGIISDSMGPVIGASIATKDGKGTITSIDGYFNLDNIYIGEVLIISYVGYKTQNIVYNGQESLNITISEDTKMLNEVVVTALGIKKETKALTYNVQEIKAADLVTVKDANFMNALSGKVAGVMINTSSSGIGGAARVVMRGTKSISGNNNALYVVDGIPLPQMKQQASDYYSGMGQSGDGIAAINADDIESMSVLSGAAAAALYGSDAANGVIMITTKKGKNEKLSVNVSNSTTFSSPFVLPQFQNSYGSLLGTYKSWGEKLKSPSKYDPNDFFQTGYNTMTSVNMSVGKEKNQTYFSASTVKARGLIPNNDLSRYNISFRNTANFLNDKMQLDLSFMYMDVQEQNMLAQGQYFNPLVPIYLFPRGENIDKLQLFERYDTERNLKVQYWPYGDMGLQMQNPYWIINRDMFNNHRSRFLMSSSLKYTITDWMSVTARAKYDGTTSLAEKKYYASTAGLFAGKTGAYHRSSGDYKQLYGDVMLNINKYINDFSITAALGTSISDMRSSDVIIGGNLHGVANLFSLRNLELSNMRPDQSDFHDQTQAVFGTVQLGYKSKVYLDLSARNDWVSSLAGTKSSSIFYPSVGLSAILTDLLPIKSNILPFMKARLSYSEVGNAPSRYVTIPTYPLTGGFPQTNTFKPDKNFRPERTGSYEVGLNAKLFDGQLGIDLTLYKSSTYNQLFHPQLPPSTGYNSLYINAGRIDNKGIEATISLEQKYGDIHWNTGLVYSLNRNEIVQLLPETSLDGGYVVSQDRLDMGGTDSYRMILTKGGSMGDIYVNHLKTDEHGYIYVGKDSYTVIADPNDFIKAGNANPKFTLGWRNSLEWKGLTFGCLINGRVGGVGVSVTQAIMDAYGASKASADARDAGGVLINGKRIPAKAYYEVVGGGKSGIGSAYTYSATNVRLAEASLGYDLPINKWVSWIKSANISVVGRNLLMIYCNAPFDPELTASTGTYYQGIDYFMQPSMRNVGFTVKLNF